MLIIMRCNILLFLFFIFLNLKFFPLSIKNYWRQHCGSPFIPSNGHVDFSKGKEVGSIAQYSCLSGYFLFGEKTRKCLPEMYWDGVPPICAKDVSHGRPVKVFDKVNEVFTYLTDEDQRTCDIVHQWVRVDILATYKVDILRATVTFVSSKHPPQKVSLPESGYSTADSISRGIFFRIGNNEDVLKNSICFYNFTHTDKHKITFNCNKSLEGRFVSIHRNESSASVLPVLCDLEVFTTNEKVFSTSQCYNTNSTEITFAIAGKCYVLFIMKKNWPAAESYCQSLSGILATFPDRAFFETVLFHLKQHKESRSNTIIEDIWIGSKWNENSKKFIWSTGTPIDSILWESDPSKSNSSSFDTCIAIGLQKSGLLKKKSCGHLGKFLCAVAPLSCGTPIRYNYESILPREAFGVNDDVEILCDSAYFRNQKDSYNRLCLQDGTWDGGRDHCELPCGEPPEIPNYSKLQLTVPFRTLGTIVYECQLDFKLKGDAPNCTSGGNWTSIPQCESIYCGNPNLPSNGLFSLIGNSKARIFCSPGWTLFGQNEIKCLDTGRWSFSDAVCLPTTNTSTVTPILGTIPAEPNKKSNIFDNVSDLHTSLLPRTIIYEANTDFGAKMLLKQDINPTIFNSTSGVKFSQNLLILSIITGLLVSVFLSLILKAIKTRFANEGLERE